tara:strand:+ start:2353 stop:2577 length:225 start_codon:yes stop_codon:yes gene_type:complete
MGISLYVIFIIIFLFIGIITMIARSNSPENFYSDLEVEEWNCHECGFHVQAGNNCIYCNAKKQNNIKTDHANAK